MAELARRHPERIGASLRRTPERRIARWKALHGPDCDVIFPQAQQPGRMGLSDFTDASTLGVTIAPPLMPASGSGNSTPQWRNDRLLDAV